MRQQKYSAMCGEISEMPLQETKETRNISLDATRVVAVAAVLLTHVSTQFVMYYDVETAQFVWGNIFDSLSRLAVVSTFFRKFNLQSLE